MERKKQSVFKTAFLVALALYIICFYVGIARAQETKIVITVNSDYFPIGSTNPLTLGLAVANSVSTSVTADVYIGFILPGNEIFCFNNPDNLNSITTCGTAKDLRLVPLVSALSLQSGLKYSTDNFFSTAPTPLASMGLPTGKYQAFGLLTHPGTLDVISMSFADFSIGGESTGTLQNARTVYATLKGNHTFQDPRTKKLTTEERELWISNASAQESHPLVWSGNTFSVSYTENISTRIAQTVSITGEVAPDGSNIKTVSLKKQVSGSCLSGGGKNEETTEYILLDIPQSSTNRTGQYRFEVGGKAAKNHINNLTYKEYSDCLNINSDYVSTDWASSQIVVVFYAD